MMQRDRFPDAASPQNANRLARLHIEAHMLQDVIVAERLRHIFEGDVGAFVGRDGLSLRFLFNGHEIGKVLLSMINDAPRNKGLIAGCFRKQRTRLLPIGGSIQIAKNLRRKTLRFEFRLLNDGSTNTRE